MEVPSTGLYSTLRDIAENLTGDGVDGAVSRNHGIAESRRERAIKLPGMEEREIKKGEACAPPIHNVC